MSIEVINIKEKAGLFSDLHSYKVIAEMNNNYFELVKARREFIWHAHENTDEVFMVVSGELTIELRDSKLVLKEGEMAVIPKGVEHKPSCEEECCIMLIEPKDTVNTGNAGGEMTDKKIQWI